MRDDLPYAEAVRSAIIGSYYSRWLGAPDRIRIRAQTVYAIPSSIAAGVLGIALLSNLSQLAVWVRWVGVASIALWAVAAVAATAAASFGVKLADADADGAFVSRVGDERDEDRQVKDIIRDSAEELSTLRRRMRIATSAVVLALVSSVATVSVAAITWPVGIREDVIVSFTADGSDQIASACGVPNVGQFRGDVAGILATSPLVDITLSVARGDACHVSVPKATITSIREQ